MKKKITILFVLISLILSNITAFNCPTYSTNNNVVCQNPCSDLTDFN